MLDPVVLRVDVSDNPQVVISDLVPGLVYEFKVKEETKTMFFICCLSLGANSNPPTLLESISFHLH